MAASGGFAEMEGFFWNFKNIKSESHRQEEIRNHHIDVWESFLKQMLKKPENYKPTSEDVELFLWKLPRLTPHLGDALPLFTIRQYRTHILDHLLFHHSLEPSSRINIRTEAVIMSLIREGRVKISRDRKAQWIRASDIVKLARFKFLWALKWGPPSWDAHVSEVLSLTLQSALMGRGGDVAMSKMWREEQATLRYEDVVMSLVLPHGEKPYFVATFTLNRSKRPRLLHRKAERSVTLRQISNPKYAYLCPVTLLITQALRYGNVDARSVDDLIAKVQYRGDKRVQWVNEGFPVLVCTTNRQSGNGAHPDPWSALSTARLSKVIQDSAMKAGLLASNLPIAHDVLRGSCKDVALLPKFLVPDVGGLELAAKMTGQSVERVARLFGTDHPSQQEDLWEKRIQWAHDKGSRDCFGSTWGDGTIAYRTKQYLDVSDRPGNLDDEFPGTGREAVRKRNLRRAHANLEEMEESDDDVDSDDDEQEMPGAKGQPNAILRELRRKVQVERELNTPVSAPDEGEWDPLEGNLELEPLAFIRRYSSINTHAFNRDEERPKSGNSREPPAVHAVYCKNRGRGCQKMWTALEISSILEHETKCVPKKAEQHDIEPENSSIQARKAKRARTDG